MSKLTKMPPPISGENWDFGTWDMVPDGRYTAPWEYRGFEYHDLHGTGHHLLIVWRYNTDPDPASDYYSLIGDIYRLKGEFPDGDYLKILLMWNRLKKKVDEYLFDGILLFDCKNNRVPYWSVCGQPFPEELPNGRWH